MYRSEAERALRLIRRRYWTIRRVGFSIAYHGVLTFLLVAPWFVVGLVLWRIGTLSSLRFPFPPVARGVERPSAPPPRDGVRRGAAVFTITEAQANAWVGRILQFTPQVQHVAVDFLPGRVVLQGTLAGPPPQALRVSLTPRVNAGSVDASLDDAAVGALPKTGSEVVVRSWLMPLLARPIAQLHDQFFVTAVAIDEQQLTVSGWPR